MQSISSMPQDDSKSILDRPAVNILKLNWEVVLFILILILAIVTRFYNLEARVMSHDETSHTYFSWLLFQGKGYQHDPVTHGPFQFHIVALTYFLLGDNDFTARVPAALFSIATVFFAWWKMRHFVGRVGALVTALLFTISPYMLFYGRYVRNEAFVAFFGLVSIWAILSYFEKGSRKYLFILTASMSLHFCIKETSYIYTAQSLLFLAFYFIYRVTQQPWVKPRTQIPFVLSLIASFISAGVAVTLKLLPKLPVFQQGGIPSDISNTPNLPQATPTIPPLIIMLLFILALLALISAAFFLIRGFGMRRIKAERSFDLLILVGTLVLPLLTAFPLNWLHWDVPINLNELNAMKPTNLIQMGSMLALMSLLAITIGLWWNPKLWISNALLFYAIFTVLYTTVFTNGGGFFTGLLGSLAYWVEQQGVNRGSQPWYYYGLVQVPMYEYLPALGTLVAFLLMGLGIKIIIPAHPLATTDSPEDLNPPVVSDSSVIDGSGDSLRNSNNVTDNNDQPFSDDEERIEPEDDISASDLYVLEQPLPEIALPILPEKPPTLALIGFWALSSLAAYSYAGEKMPWITVHIALPFILMAGWAIGYLIETTDWSKFRSAQGWLVVALVPVFLAGGMGAAGSLLGSAPPFQGKNLDQLQATSTFLTAFLGMIASGWGLVVLLKNWRFKQIARIFILAFFAFLTLLTSHVSVLANYINYDNAVELLVYAHCGPGVKVALAQIEELSRRTADSLTMPVAYDDSTSYPYWWYLRNYSDQRFYGKNPTRDLRQVPAILVGDGNYGKIEPVVGQAYYQFEYIRMWWPNQDYFNLDWERIRYALFNPQMRSALFQIWLNHDYRQYGSILNRDMSAPKWEPAERMRLYLRKDLASQLWNYGTSVSAESVTADPYEGKGVQLFADKVLGGPGIGPGQFNAPRAMAFAPDGTIYVADSGNHRIQHLAVDGTVMTTWGSYGKTEGGVTAPEGTFDEPWGIAVGPDGSVYVSDTWNHRIQKFTPDGTFLKTWGSFGQAETPFALWGPRGIIVDPSTGNVLVADTGNKRVVIYDAEGNFVSQFGGDGFAPGQFNEPVGIAIDNLGHLYVADTWNQRVQVFSKDVEGNYTPLTNWEIVGWYGQSLDNKPYIAVDTQGHVFTTDPDGYRVLEFTTEGQFIRYWGDFGVTNDKFGIPNGIVIDPKKGIWVVDSANARLMHFVLPE